MPHHPRHLILTLLLPLILTGCGKSSYQENVQEQLAVVIEEEGRQISQEGGWLNIDSTDLRVKARIVEEFERDDGFIAQVETEVAFSPSSKRTILNQVGGLAAERKEAAKDAVMQWALGSLPVLLEAFAGEDSRSVYQEVYQSKSSLSEVDAWRMFFGPFTFRGTPPDAKFDFPKTLQSMIQKGAKENDIHWIAINYARTKDEVLTLEAFFDNQKWEMAETAMKSLKWPETEKFYSISQFIVIKPEL